MLVRTFSEEDAAAPGPPGESSAPEYAFEGFNVEFSDKVMLTPLVPRGGQATGQSVAGAFGIETKEETHDDMPRDVLEKINRDEDSRQARQRIINLAAESDIAQYSWNKRGVAPAGYIRGMSLVYARVYCKLRNGDAAAIEMAKANTGDPNLDALAHYAPEFSAAGMNNDVAGTDTLRHLFVLLIGLGMRESSGKYCAGRDTGANNTAADTAEAGLFQTSFNASKASALMLQLFQQYSLNPSGFVEVFREGVICTNADLQDFGNGEGAEFQRLSKASPAFAAEFAAVGLRNIRRHWGPINAKTAEIRPECDAMLQKVQNLVDGSNCCPLFLD